MRYGQAPRIKKAQAKRDNRSNQPNHTSARAARPQKEQTGLERAQEQERAEDLQFLSWQDRSPQERAHIKEDIKARTARGSLIVRSYFGREIQKVASTNKRA